MEPERREVSVSPRMAQILKIFLEDPARLRYGYELMTATGLPSGTIYPILAFLEKQGWLQACREDIDPKAAGRPARRAFVLTADGYLQAMDRLNAIADSYRPPAPPTGRPTAIRPGGRV
ncbi:PadR family transcriptional regulator [Planomonospora sp. ID82291]|uniref:PadR family transcriptional regulator n=1 Tax=Planomonospora sp. ID82291 TaxID=2738136 RepID=UPI0018C40DA3|nr:helix-turn-helix transcriptional regulator [Planomonospora sp. ID82291]MBG0818285.1 helix-turn-helix transcriptional regulator [Planomonospora sp. ID82291]